MHEFMLDCLYLLAILLSMLGITSVILVLIGAVKGVVDLIDRKHDDE